MTVSDDSDIFPEPEYGQPPRAYNSATPAASAGPDTPEMIAWLERHLRVTVVAESPLAIEACERRNSMLDRVIAALRSLPREGEAPVAWKYRTRNTVVWHFTEHEPLVSGLNRDLWEVVPLFASPLPAPETGRQWSHCPGCGLVVRLTESGRFVHHELFERRDSALDLPVRKVCNGSGAVAAPPLPAGRPEEDASGYRRLKQGVLTALGVTDSWAITTWNEKRICEAIAKAALTAGRGSEVSEEMTVEDAWAALDRAVSRDPRFAGHLMTKYTMGQCADALKAAVDSFDPAALGRGREGAV